MKINKTNILLVIIGILAAYSIFQGSKIRTDVAGYNAKIDSIQNEIDSVMLVNESLNKEIVKIDGQIGNIDGDITKVQKNITIIKNQTDEKINVIDSYNFSDLNRFFTDRYEARHDSTSQSTNR